MINDLFASLFIKLDQGAVCGVTALGVACSRGGVVLSGSAGPDRTCAVDVWWRVLCRQHVQCVVACAMPCGGV